MAIRPSDFDFGKGFIREGKGIYRYMVNVTLNLDNNEEREYRVRCETLDDVYGIVGDAIENNGATSAVFTVTSGV